MENLKPLFDRFNSKFKNEGDCYLFLYNHLSTADNFPKKMCGKIRINPGFFLTMRLTGLTFRYDYSSIQFCQKGFIEPQFVKPQKRKKYFAKCNYCDRYFTSTKGTFFENRKIDLVHLFRAILIAEFYNYSQKEIFSCLKDDLLIKSIYTAPFRLTRDVISDRRLKDLVRDLVNLKYREELQGYRIMAYINSET